MSLVIAKKLGNSLNFLIYPKPSWKTRDIRKVRDVCGLNSCMTSRLYQDSNNLAQNMGNQEAAYNRRHNERTTIQ